MIRSCTDNEKQQMLQHYCWGLSWSLSLMISYLLFHSRTEDELAQWSKASRRGRTANYNLISLKICLGPRRGWVGETQFRGSKADSTNFLSAIRWVFFPHLLRGYSENSLLWITVAFMGLFSSHQKEPEVDFGQSSLRILSSDISKDLIYETESWQIWHPEICGSLL